MRLKKYKSVWFDLPESLSGDGARIEIQYLNEGKHSALKGKISPIKESMVFKKGEKKPFVETSRVLNPATTLLLTAVAYIKNWENFLDEEGKQLSCNDKNKKLFAMENGFMDFVRECIELVNQKYEPEEKEEAPNSETSQDG